MEDENPVAAMSSKRLTFRLPTDDAARAMAGDSVAAVIDSLSEGDASPLHSLRTAPREAGLLQTACYRGRHASRHTISICGVGEALRGGVAPAARRRRFSGA